MNRLDRLVLREIIGLFIGGVLLFTGLFFAAGEIVRLAGFLQSGTGLLIVGQLLLFTLPNVLAFTFPMAMLLATLLGFGRLSGDLEIVALTAAGVRFERIMAPVAAFAACVGLLGYWLNNNLAPYASEQRNIIIKRVKNGEIGNGLLSAEIFPIKRKTGNNRYTIINAEGIENLARGELRNVSVEQWQDGRLEVITYAPQAVWQVGTQNWTLFDPTVVLMPDTAKRRGGLIGTAEGGGVREVKQEIDTPTQLAYLRTLPEDTSTTLLLRRAQYFRQAGNEDEARGAEVEVAKRQSLPWASFVFALVGAPLGVQPKRSGKGVGFGLSVVITFAYWISLQVVSVLGRGGILPPMLALWLPNIACFIVGLVLIRRVLRS